MLTFVFPVGVRIRRADLLGGDALHQLSELSRHRDRRLRRSSPSGTCRIAATWFLAAAILFATVLSFGKFLPILYGPMFKWLPYFNKFRVPVMALIVQQLAAVAHHGDRRRGVPEAPRREAAAAVARARTDEMDSSRERRSRSFSLVIASGGIRSGIAGNPAIASRISGSALDFASSAFAANLMKTLGSRRSSCASSRFSPYRAACSANTVVLAIAVVAAVDLFMENGNILHPEKGWPGSQAIIADRSARDEIREAGRGDEFSRRPIRRSFASFRSPPPSSGNGGTARRSSARTVSCPSASIRSAGITPRSSRTTRTS